MKRIPGVTVFAALLLSCALAYASYPHFCRLEKPSGGAINRNISISSNPDLIDPVFHGSPVEAPDSNHGYYVSPSDAITDHGDNSIVGSLQYYVSRIRTSTPARIVLPANHTYPVLTSLNIPSNIHIEHQPGAILKWNRPVTITQSNPPIAGLWQIYDGNGPLTFSRSVKTVYPEWWGGDGNGADDTVAVVAAHDSLPTSGGTIDFSNKIWRFNLTITKNNIRIKGGGHHWINFADYSEGMFPADNDTAMIQIGDNDTNVYGTVIERANIRGGTNGKKGIHVRQAWSTTISESFISNFDTWNLKVGDSTNTLTDVQSVRFVNSGSYTYGKDNATETDNIRFEQNIGSSATTDVHFDKFILFGPALGTGYQVHGMEMATWSNGYYEVYASGKGGMIHGNSQVSLKDVIIEGASGGVLVKQTQQVAGDERSFEVLQGKFAVIGLYEDAVGKTYNMSSATHSQPPYSMAYFPYMMQPVVKRDMKFVDDNWDMSAPGAGENRTYGTLSHYGPGNITYLKNTSTRTAAPESRYSKGTLHLRSDNGTVEISYPKSLRGMVVVDDQNATALDVTASDGQYGIYAHGTGTATVPIGARTSGGWYAGTFDGTTGGGISGAATSGNGVSGSATSGTGVHAQATSGIGLSASSSKGSPAQISGSNKDHPAISAWVDPPDDNSSILPIAEFGRYVDTGGTKTLVSGAGGSINIKLQNSSGRIINGAQLVFTLRNAADGNETITVTLKALQDGNMTTLATWNP